MCAAYKWVLLALVAGWSFLVFPKDAGSYGTLVGNCNEEKECVVFLNNEVPTRDELCNSSDASVFWTQGTDRYLLQCKSGDTAEDNVVWVVDLRTGFFGRLNYGRSVRKSELEKNPDMQIPDKFTSRSLCDSIDTSKLEAIDFVLLDKKPTNDDENPYCYDPTYLTIKSGHLVIDTNNGPVKSSDSDHAVHKVSARYRERLGHLLEAVREGHPEP